MNAGKAIFFAGLLLLGLQACKKPASTATTTFKGLLVKKDWSKSVQSYCAQGSEYYVLQTKDTEWVLVFADNIQLSTVENNWVNKKVTIEGNLVEKKIAPPENDMSPRPVQGFGDSQDFECTVLKVISLQAVAR